MAHKTFISYKYSEAKDLRDRIIEELGDDAKYYRGETAESPDLTGTTIDSIKNHLKDMMFDTTVTIVIISPNLKESKWVDWELKYSLKEITRRDKTSRTNGIIGVIMKVNNSYDWLISYTSNSDGCRSRMIDNSILCDIINKNRYNLNTNNRYSCPICKTFDQLNGSYIALVEEDDFLNNPDKYIENAFSKCQSIWNYDITKE
ncbi:TIR domain-containing protein [Bacteroides fragilis]|jgi:MTH538 TIR-like domain (DUF1863)|nr:TIR domain-containing protein [Bacteroides fragilis]